MKENKFNFQIGYALSSQLSRISDEIRIQNRDIQQKYIDLNDTFKDEGYNQFKEEFQNCDKSIEEISDTLNELSVLMNKYASELEKVAQ